MKAKNKNSRNIASGQKINTASDNSSFYAISEKMRMMRRATDQNEQNVQNASSLLQTAEGGIQNQIELMKRVKALVIESNNGILSDRDLAAIQQDLDSCFAGIEDIALGTKFNDIPLLIGSKPNEVVIDWAKLEEAEIVKNSQLDLIPGGTEPFSKVQPYTFDFTGKTAAELKGQSFTMENSDGTTKTYMFADYYSPVPDGVTRIPVSDETYDYSSADIAQNFARIVTGNNELAYRRTGSSTEIFCGPDRKPIKFSGLENFTDWLIKAINDQALSKLKDTDHFMSMQPELDPDGNFTGSLIMYDNRMILDPDTKIPRADNAVIHDGIKSNWMRADRSLDVAELYIQHMSRSNMNIHILIPRTTLDNIFNYNTQYHHISEYNVLSQKSRDDLLGTTEKDGALDKALNYLLTANTLVGAQNMRLSYAEENIVTYHESLANADSVIRDTDMAKEMTDFSKNQILEKTGQAMLAQASQNTTGILSLLQ